MNVATGDSRRTRRSSDLSKHSAEVFAEAEQGPMTVTRRDGESLVLMSFKEAEGRAQLLDLAAKLISVTVDGVEPLSDRMATAFPWILALSDSDREQCTHDLIDAARASFATEQPHLALAKLTAWNETASAIAAGLTGSSAEWLDDAPRVKRP